MPPPPAAPARGPRQVLSTLWLPGLLGLLLAVALAVLHQFDPARSRFYPGCTLHRLTGLNCPGCGGLRATHQLLHGQVASAFQHNALVVLAAPVLAGWAGLWLWRRWRGIPPKLRRFPAAWLWVMFGGVALFTVLRNLPGPWFAWLSP